MLSTIIITLIFVGAIAAYGRWAKSKGWNVRMGDGVFPD